VDDFPAALKSTDHVVDAIFGACSRLFSYLPTSARTVISQMDPGFSFSGEIREPFPAVIQALEKTKLPVTSVDAPSSWDIENGPPKAGVGSAFNPAVLVSLTAPKPLVNHFRGRHFVGGRCVPRLESPSRIEY
jgi:NAD(P)H-hydrate epimerase